MQFISWLKLGFPRCSKYLGAIMTIAILTSGCSTVVTYTPQATQGTRNLQTLKYTQGVGVLSVKDTDQEVFMYPTYRTQGPGSPTFTIGYANNGIKDVNFSPDNVKAYFRGESVPLYSYVERIAEIQSQKQAKQVLLAIAGGLAAGATAHAASRETRTTNYYSSVRSSRGYSTRFAGTLTTHVYDPAKGILAGAAVGGTTVLGIRQLEYSAQAEEQAAASMLQANTVKPLQMVSGDLIMKNCCDQFVKADDILRFEVTAQNKTYIFNFARQNASSAR
jgi:hypothetical protein